MFFSFNEHLVSVSLINILTLLELFINFLNLNCFIFFTITVDVRNYPWSENSKN